MRGMFCNSCGARLEVKDVGKATREASAHNQFVKLGIQIGVGVVVLIILIPLVMSLVPQGSLEAATPGTRRAGDDARGKLGSLVDAKNLKADEAKILLSEEEVNGYLMLIRNRIGNPDKVTIQVAIHRSKFHARIIAPRQKPAMLKSVFPTVSYDLIGVCDGHKLYPVKAKVGHLSVIGGRKREVFNSFMKLRQQATPGEEALLNVIRTIDLDDDVVILDI